MTTPAPAPLLIRLAHALLDRADRSQGLRAVTLKLDAKVLPELHATQTPDDLARITALLQSLVQTGWVTLRTKKPRAFQTLADQDPTLVLHDALALASWSGHQPVGPKWSRELVAQLGAPGVLEVPDAPALLDYLQRNPLPWFAGMPAGEVAQVLNALATACAATPGRPTLFLRELSARHFKGHSKVLDKREECMRLLGAEADQFPEGPVQLLICLPEAGTEVGPQGFDEILFIENLVTFERMALQRQPAWAHCALVFASGFKGAARRLRHPRGASLYWRGPAPAAAQAFTQWLHGPAHADLPVSFYGDLDFAGLQILAQLRQTFVHCVAWRPGYGALATAMQAGQGHPPERAGKQAQTDPGHTGCPDADQVLLPLLRESGLCIDQESWPADMGLATVEPTHEHRH
ncbi:Wadjet anti-phage system protein JetD domain-containing protein [Aquabacterium sp. UBA2148]|uniref:Wadjet anti-phage system protein JetD domain-containing protein n=1 Tax=Aquabacterium sp. UBA2148 TaxID=1946042 RepID=UPI0025797294|nr:Wadjet anti-phage system protein JetD domain-containing protein [Aquabacterium sp. UBA2148]